jgi:hypothetical protein
MLTLEELLQEKIQRLGQDHPSVQMLRNQIAAEKSGKTLQEVYLTGSVKKQPSRSEQEHVLDLLRQFNIPVTRENYLDLAYPEGLPDDWGSEGEAGLPIEIRKI